MNKKLTGKATVTIKQPIAKVWAALTQPELVKQYFYGTNVESDWKKGSPIRFKGEWEGKAYEDKGTILESDPPKKVTYSYWSSMSGTEDKPENYANVTYELSETNGVTTLVITQEGIASEEAKTHSEQNWSTVMDGMRKMLED